MQFPQRIKIGSSCISEYIGLKLQIFFFLIIYGLYSDEPDSPSSSAPLISF